MSVFKLIKEYTPCQTRTIVYRRRVTGRLEWPGGLFTTASKREGTCPMKVKQSLAWYV